MTLTVTAGSPATAAQYNALIPLYVPQSSSQALATTTYTAHNAFNALAFGVGETWAVRVNLWLDSATDGNDAKVRWATTGGLSLFGRRFIWAPDLSVTVSPINVTMNAQVRATTDSVSGGVGTSTTNGTAWVEEFIVQTVGTAGTLTMEWAQNAAVSGTTTMRSGSFLIAHRVA